MTGGAYIQARDVVFDYAPGIRALDGLALDIGRARLACLLGPNGSGKTTFLRLLAGLLEPCAGHISLAGTPLSEYPRAALARRVAYVPQETAPSFGFTALETVLMGRSPHTGALGFETAGDWHVARQALRETDAEEFAGRCLDELSGGQRQRVIIARALAQEPDLVLLDEPTSFLDLRHQHAIFGLLRRLVAERGMTVISVSHDVNLAAAYADDIAVLSRGKVAAAGSPHEVLKPGMLSAVYELPVEVRTDEVTGRPYVIPRPEEKRARPHGPAR